MRRGAASARRAGSAGRADRAAARARARRAEQAFALAGDAALLAGERGRDLAVVPALAGGAGRVVFRFRAPEGAVPEARLSASAQRAGLVVTTADDGSTLRATQPFSGTVGGLWEPLAPLTELAPASSSRRGWRSRGNGSCWWRSAAT